MREHLLSAYDLSANTQCQFYTAGLHDNYLIVDEGRKFILRVYRNAWRSTEDIQFELELLKDLQRHGCPAAFPVLTHQNNSHTKFECSGESRTMVLFSFAPGTVLGPELHQGHCRLLGSTVAKIHQVADLCDSQHSKQVLDLDYLLDASVGAIHRFLTPEQRAYVQSVQEKIRIHMPDLPRQAPLFGRCLGDVNPSNCHITDDGHITVFDFDQCGYGWRAFEIGKFFATIRRHSDWKALMTSFLQGYETVRALEVGETRALGYFTLAADIWVMAIHAYNADYVGYKILGPEFWARRISELKDLEAADHLWVTTARRD